MGEMPQKTEIAVNSVGEMPQKKRAARSRLWRIRSDIK